MIADWRKTVFFHTGWTSHYDGTEAPEGGHEYLRKKIGFERGNFKPVDGWCFGYAPVSKAEKGAPGPIKEDGRTLNIIKLGAGPRDEQVGGVTVIWTARRPGQGSVIVGIYKNAIAMRNVLRTGPDHAFIAKAKADDCVLIEESMRHFVVPQKKKGFPGQAAAWFPGQHSSGPAAAFLEDVANYLSGFY